MSLFLQDGLVTLLSIGAAAVLVQRIFTVIKPRPINRPCTGCSHCPATKNAPPAPRLSSRV